MNDNYNIIKVNGKKKKLSRHLMEKKLDRKLNYNELVHHKNGNKKDDRIENLEILSKEEHTSLHHAGRRK